MTSPANTDEDGDVIMTDAESPASNVPVANGTSAATESTGDQAADDMATEPAAEAGPPPEEKVGAAETLKEEGNAMLKAGNLAGATSKYVEGIALMEPLLEKGPAELGEDLQLRSTAAYTALRLNCAQACLKLSDWVQAIEHADKVVLIDKDNTKALYRRGLAAVQLDTEGRLEGARADFTRVATLDPANREVRSQLAKAKQRLQELKQAGKDRLSQAMQGGLYQEQHDKLGKLQVAYETEVKRRKDAGEDEISYEDWLKKQKEREEDEKKKQKEALEKQRQEEQEKRRREAYEQELARRKEAGEPMLSFEEWEEELRVREEEIRKARVGMKTDEADLDAEEKKLLEETRSKGYYHGRLGTVLSDAAPKPQQVDSNMLAQDGQIGSEWNVAGTWEEKDMTTWAKERLTVWLGQGNASASQVTLPEGKPAAVTAKVTKVKSLNGDAHLVMVRKKLKHGYHFEAELSFSLDFKVEDGHGGGSKHFSGTLSLPELMDAVPVAELRMDARWKGTGPSEGLTPLAIEWLDKLRESVRSQVSGFCQEYQQRR